MKYLLLSAIILTSYTANAQVKAQLLGCWKMPSRPGETLQLNGDGNFFFNDYNTMTKATEKFYGTWKIEKKTVTLMYDDRPQQRFFLSRDKKGQWILKKAGGFQFIKGTPAECEAR